MHSIDKAGSSTNCNGNIRRNGRNTNFKMCARVGVLSSTINATEQREHILNSTKMFYEANREQL